MDAMDMRYTNTYVVTDDSGRDVVKSEAFDVVCVQIFQPQQFGTTALCWVPRGTKYHCSCEEWKDHVNQTAYGPMNQRQRVCVEREVVSNGEWLTVNIKQLEPVFAKKLKKFL